MGTIRVKRVDGPAKKKKRKDKGPPGSPRSGSVGKKKWKKKGEKKKVAKKKTATAIVKPKPRADAPLATRTTRVERAHERLERVLNFDNCPADYASLKFEARYLSGLSTYSFALMAQRLTRIRDEKLYVADGYPDFKSFVTAEIEVSTRTVRRYLDVYSLFGERAEALGADVEYSKLLPALPLLRITREERAREALVDRFLAAARAKSYRQIKEEAERLLEERVGKKKPEKKRDFAAEVDDFIGRLPRRPTKKDLAKLDELAREITRLKKRFARR